MGDFTKHQSDALIATLDVWNALSDIQRFQRFRALSATDMQHLFESITSADRCKLISFMDKPQRTLWLGSLEASDIAAVLREAKPALRSQLLESIDPTQRGEISAILAYDDDSAGGLMSLGYLRLRKQMTVDQGIDYIRKQLHHPIKTDKFAYVVSDTGHLDGLVRLRSLLTSHHDSLIESIMESRFEWVTESMDAAEVQNRFKRARLAALPVLDVEGCMKGVLLREIVLDAVTERTTQEIQKLGATEALDAPYLDVGFIPMMRKRAGWLCALFVGEMLTATAMGHFEAEIERAVVLALFIPLIISSGGNSGSQASTLLVRALALGEVKLRDWWKVFSREVLNGLCLGLILGSIGFLRIILWPSRIHDYGEHYVLVACTVAASLVGVVLWGSLSGSMLPFLLRKLGFDPATASAPFVATLVDVTGLIIYFSCAKIFLSGTLL